ncbi:hypothetical protein BC829DRAFT_432895 [Chytridium lagenaria]|nr:hypothetical protein BC829DRAFT_432895 [Chytridium lagenaria]
MADFDSGSEDEDFMGSGNRTGDGLSPSPASPLINDDGTPVIGTSSGLGSVLKKKPKRANHNELERKRRHSQRQALTLLKDTIPSLKMDKPSTILIMEKAREYILTLRKRVVDLEAELERSRQTNVPGVPTGNMSSNHIYQAGGIPPNHTMSHQMQLQHVIGSPHPQHMQHHHNSQQFQHSTQQGMVPTPTLSTASPNVPNRELGNISQTPLSSTPTLSSQNLPQSSNSSSIDTKGFCPSPPNSTSTPTPIPITPVDFSQFPHTGHPSNRPSPPTHTHSSVSTSSPFITQGAHTIRNSGTAAHPSGSTSGTLVSPPMPITHPSVKRTRALSSLQPSRLSGAEQIPLNDNEDLRAKLMQIDGYFRQMSSVSPSSATSTSSSLMAAAAPSHGTGMSLTSTGGYHTATGGLGSPGSMIVQADPSADFTRKRKQEGRETSTPFDTSIGSKTRHISHQRDLRLQRLRLPPPQATSSATSTPDENLCQCPQARMPIFRLMPEYAMSLRGDISEGGNISTAVPTGHLQTFMDPTYPTWRNPRTVPSLHPNPESAILQSQTTQTPLVQPLLYPFVTVADPMHMNMSNPSSLSFAFDGPKAYGLGPSSSESVAGMPDHHGADNAMMDGNTPNAQWSMTESGPNPGSYIFRSMMGPGGDTTGEGSGDDTRRGP